MSLPDIIIPLGSESKRDNIELKIFLRSIEKNCSGTYGRVFVVTDRLPDWLAGVEHVYAVDDLPHNKDGNIIAKVVRALEASPETETFVWSCDDHVVMRPTDLSALPPIYNNRGKRDFMSPGGNSWQKRVLRTFEFLEGRGVRLTHNYEAHVPQLHRREPLLTLLKDVDYRAGNGYTINTLFYGLCGVTGGVEQGTVKTTCERETDADRPFDRQFVGYNDRAFLRGLCERLLATFPAKSHYER